MDTQPVSRPRALVTGASSGIGKAFAERLARDGYDLVIVARRRERLDELAERWEQAHGVTVRPLVADLTDPAALQTVERHVAGGDGLDLLINNAGFAGYMPFIQLDPDWAEALIRLHVLVTTRLTRAGLPGMIGRGRGAVVNVASLLGFSASIPNPSPMPKRAVYAACKAYIIAFTEALHHELEGAGVQVQALCPGGTRGTELHDGMPGFDESRFQIDANEIVMASLAGLRLGEVICIPGLDEPGLIAEERAGERRILERAGRGTLAQRYSASSQSAG